MICSRSNKEHLIFTVPGDKSISHRAIMLGSLANGLTKIRGLLPSLDCISTITCFRQLGVRIHQICGDRIHILGDGIGGLKQCPDFLNVGNSGTTIRLLSGILAASALNTTLIGDCSIEKRPMDRVVAPLRNMGARIDGRQNGKYVPLRIEGTTLEGISYKMPISSAQVKSCLLLAGLHARGTTYIHELIPSRDHTERMLTVFGVDIVSEDNQISIRGGQELAPANIQIPGDISSAAFLLSIALLIPGTKVTVEGVGLNTTRTGILDVFDMMGADVFIELTDMWGLEPVGRVTVFAGELGGIRIDGEIIPRLIDEIPLLAVIATQVRGETIICDASELKVKETNRIEAMVQELRNLGADIEGTEDGFRIAGPTILKGGVCNSHGDHRIAMALTIAGLITRSPVVITNKRVTDISFPGFQDEIDHIIKILAS